MTRDSRFHPDKSSITQHDISALVTAFYAKVRLHPRLGPIFEHHIGLTDADWHLHQQKIEAFWANVMLGARAYRGNPMQAHMAVPGITKTDFESWLALFDATANKILPANKAEVFSTFAHRIGQSLWIGLQRSRETGGPPSLSL